MNFETQLRQIKFTIINIDEFLNSYGEILEDFEEIINQFLNEYPSILNKIILKQDVEKSSHSLKGIVSMMFPNGDITNILKQFQLNARNNILPTQSEIDNVQNILILLANDLSKIKKILS